jgi:hypothetical protein
MRHLIRDMKGEGQSSFSRRPQSSSTGLRVIPSWLTGSGDFTRGKGYGSLFSGQEIPALEKSLTITRRSGGFAPPPAPPGCDTTALPVHKKEANLCTSDTGASHAPPPRTGEGQAQGGRSYHIKQAFCRPRNSGNSQGPEYSSCERTTGSMSGKHGCAGYRHGQRN